ncbi:hypothetical protein FBZ87_105115 [Nitrospirillum amazonense]|uniref:Uncharacterized protein n=1 Tax=Nitrospirillum amazonense TaxID=28077 RepID=A0A560JQ02_9PROT|nr:hypothetical protein [Nitrospirillum amazonense]TWB73195.1 hypothetical protein FBZ87_105115 [Nitrospirillum amazonense]
MNDRIVISDGRSSVTLNPPEADPDGHGFDMKVDLVGGPFTGSILATTYLSLQAWDRFRSDLRRLHKSLKGEVSTDTWFSNFSLVLKGDGRGHVRVTAHAQDEWADASTLSFSFTIDQTHLLPIMVILDRWA